MAQTKHKAEKVVAKLRQVDVLLSRGRLLRAIRTIGVTSFTKLSPWTALPLQVGFELIC